MMKTLTVLVSVFLLVSCANLQVANTHEDRLARQLVFTIPDGDHAVPGAFSGGTAEKDSDSLVQKILQLHGLKKIAQWSIKALGLEAIVAEVRGERNINEVLSALESDRRIESVQQAEIYKVLSYNDPYYNLQTSVKHDDFNLIHGLATGKGVVVGIVDTGMDREHPELVGRVMYSRNFVDHDRRFDSDEHGTSVAGILGASANNNVGIVGVAPEVKLMAFKACRQDTRGAECDSISLMKALIDVLDQRPDVLNLSIAGPENPLIKRLLRAAADKGIILVGAVDPDQVFPFPASMDEVIAVRSPIETVGLQLPEYGLVAPGTDMLTTTPGGTYAFKSGSSMAAAWVSGVVALMKERQPELSGQQALGELRASSRS
ncbi:MAG: S8 family serine peptidase, partial [Pseudomonadales bacterium]